MVTAKDAHTLTSYYKAGYKKKYGRDPIMNRYAARWGFDAVLMDMSLTEAKELIDYYFRTESPRQHSLEWFLYNYEKLIESRTIREADDALQQKIMAETAERARRWRELGNHGIEDNQLRPKE